MGLDVVLESSLASRVPSSVPSSGAFQSPVGLDVVGVVVGLECAFDGAFQSPVGLDLVLGLGDFVGHCSSYSMVLIDVPIN